MALLAPCCVSVMLLAYFATGFRRRSRIRPGDGHLCLAGEPVGPAPALGRQIGHALGWLPARGMALLLAAAGSYLTWHVRGHLPNVGDPTIADGYGRPAPEQRELRLTRRWFVRH